jgi:branched-chain amino acid transport system permease protein
MDWLIAGVLAQDGITSGAIYALLALALVLVFSATRVIFIPQGEFVALGALTLAVIESGKAPLTTWFLLGLGVLAFLTEAHGIWRSNGARAKSRRRLLLTAGKYLLLPLMLHLVTQSLDMATLPALVQILFALCIVVPMGPLLYRVVYQPLVDASTLVLLIVSVSVHFALTGLALALFGAEGTRTKPMWEASFALGDLTISGQSLVVVMTSVVLIIALYLYFDRTLSGKALRATAINRNGARLMGIGPASAGRLAFTLAAAIGALCGILIGPVTTIFYDSGFLIGLKGFVGAIFGGLASYPAAAAGALLVGLLESYSSFWASAFKEVIVFTLIIPVLLWRSLNHLHVGDEE